MAEKAEYGSGDILVLMVTGAKGQRPEQLVNETFNLGDFMDEWGEAYASPEFDPKEALKLAASDPAAFQAQMADFTKAAISASGSSTLDQRIISAVCKYLESLNILISDSDPGVNKWYVSPADMKVITHKVNGVVQRTLLMRAPFGHI